MRSARSSKKNLILSIPYAKKHGSPPDKNRLGKLVSLRQKAQKARGDGASKTLLYPIGHPFWMSFGELDKVKVLEGKVKYLFDFAPRTGDSACKNKWKDPRLIAEYKRLEMTRKWASPSDVLRTRKWYQFRGDTYSVGNTKSAFLFLRAALRAGIFIRDLLESARFGYRPLARTDVLELVRTLRPDNPDSRDFRALGYEIRSLLKLLKA